MSEYEETDSLTLKDLEMSYLETLLHQDEPLEAYEVTELEHWLLVLRDDVETFGPTAEDISRMNQIKAKVAAAKK